VDSKYPDRMVGICFYKYPNPKTQLAKSLRWIKACGPPYEQLHSGNINVNKVNCSKLDISKLIFLTKFVSFANDLFILNRNGLILFWTECIFNLDS